MNCEYCQSPVHIWFQCPKKPDGWKPARLAKKSGSNRAAEPAATPDKSTAEKLGSPNARHEALGNVAGVTQVAGSGVSPPVTRQAGSKSLPVDTNAAQESYGAEGLRPNDAPAKFDKKTWQRNYMRTYMRKRRAKEKEGADR